MSQAAPSGMSNRSEHRRAGDAQGQSAVTNKGTNPLATKVSAVLSTSYSDAEFRGTLALIDQRGIRNDGKTRRRLRLELQKDVIEKNGRILDDFSTQLRRIKTILDKLNTDYSEMKRMVAAAHSEMEPSLAEASALLEKRRNTERRRHLLQALRDRFVLSEDEELALTSTVEPVNDAFFAALAKAKKITQDCEVLLGFERQTLASEIMEKASQNIGFAYQKLYKWVQREFKILDLENPQMNATMRKSLTVLAARPSLFQNCLDFFADARQHILSGSFFNALTGDSAGEGSAAVKPIDMIAHDPLRYVGDMLAWIHSAAVSEREVLEVLFIADGEEIVKGINSGRDAELWRIISDGEDEEFNTLNALNNLTDRDVSGAARILRQRVEQVIQANEDPILAYKLANLLKFYGIMLLKLLGPDCRLLDSVHSMEKEAMRQFRALLREHISAVRAEPQTMPSDLSPPVFLQDALKQVQVMLSTYETSLSSTESGEAGLEEVLTEAIDPFILDSEALARSLPLPRSSIYLINCRLAVSNYFKQSNLTSKRGEQIRTSINGEAAVLTDSQLDFFHQGSGLSDVIATIKQRGHYDVDFITASKLSASSSELDHFLPSAYIDALERLGELQDLGIARKITDEAAERFCTDFELLEKYIDGLCASQGDSDGNGSFRAVFPRTASEIRRTSTGRAWAQQETNPGRVGLGFDNTLRGTRTGSQYHDPAFFFKATIAQPSLARSIANAHIDYYVHNTFAMLRNRVFTALQKTYDESYLSCSTAVYYESQGDETEALRHWRNAIALIYEHNATKAIPGYGPQTDTEKALVDALKELELQCKERLDLLEALKASREDETSSDTGGKTSKTPSPFDSPTRSKGSIGSGTIPAVTYSQLSRPVLPPRPPLPIRTLSEIPQSGESSHASDAIFHTRSGSRPPALSVPPKSDRAYRSPSPEKHTMRTTLRSSKFGEKGSAPSRKSARPVAEGSSKAATLAWSALGSRERLQRTPPAENMSSTSTNNSKKVAEHLFKKRSTSTQWDSHSRRLVQPKDIDGSTNGQSTGARHSDEYPYTNPSFLSVSAASSALSSTAQLESQPTESTSARLERHQPSRPLVRQQKQEHVNGSRTADESGEWSDRRSASGAPMRRKVVTRQPGASAATQSTIKPEQTTRHRRRDRPKTRHASVSSISGDDAEGHNVKSNNNTSANRGIALRPGATTNNSRPSKRNEDKKKPVEVDNSSETSEETEESIAEKAWKRKKASILRNLPLGVDEGAAKQILNDIVIKGDEVRWGDIAGLEIAKNALRETVVYPFLRPDLFMGLREPARGMLLFGPPGTGKTMLARAVATESRSTFFSISASSLTSKYLGESEKLVRALFGLARSLAPSIIFVDEIDSLLSQRSGSGEHEATRRIKTEFLIQWSDLQRAAAGRETTERDKERGDANRVLVLAATNLPWAIDEAARRRFVRRQYIPLPEPTTRETQIRTLLGQQKHSLSPGDVQRLVGLTNGFSGSDITALAKDAAMGPLRSLGEALLHMTMDEIRPIGLVDFEASLGTIRPSVSKSGLKEYEDWAQEFGERGG
ncbi:AAA-core [Cordyceps militaris]|uniref:Conserved oligomeric Golgi complex subunit 6 n=1 Tax=Cordyceps militaris TaxID=73501 RepID=A0A2H4SNS5_CORMI|nr:AAA-core [Cordyceps militaris]